MTTQISRAIYTNEAMFDDTQNNRCLAGNQIITAVVPPDVLSCLRICLMHRRCNSMNYNSLRRVCELPRGTLRNMNDRTRLRQNEGWVHYDAKKEVKFL